jgi:hypothetical protein
MVTVDGFDSSALFAQIAARLQESSPAEKEAVLKKAKAVFQFDVKVTWINVEQTRYGTTVDSRFEIEGSCHQGTRLYKGRHCDLCSRRRFRLLGEWKTQWPESLHDW